MKKHPFTIAALVAGVLVMIAASADAATGGQVHEAVGEVVCCACAWVQSLFG